MSKQKVSKGTKVILIVLAAILAITAIGMIARSANSKTQSLKALSWEVGGIDQDGEFVKDTSSIVTRNFVNVKGLKIELAKNATVSYRLYFYDKNQEFISADTADNTGDYAGELPEGAVYCKIVIKPAHDAEVSLLEVAGYAKQLEVVFAK